MKIEIKDVPIEAMDIASEDGEEIGIWIPCTRHEQEELDGQVCNVKIEIVE
jgi:hypothetical protein